MPYVWVWGFFSFTVMALAGLAWRAYSPPSSSPSAGEIEARDLPVFAGVTLLTGLGGFVGFLWWAALPTQPWYFLPPMALAAACFELVVPALRRQVYGLLLAFVAVTALLSVLFAWRAVHWRFTNIDLLARRLAARASPSDFVLVAPWNRGISFARYFQAPPPWETVPPLSDHSTHRYDLLQRQTQTKDVMRHVLLRMASTLQAGHRVWLVAGRAMDIPLAPAPIEGDLDPPPLEHTGWSTGPYVRRWTSQAAQFLRNQSRRFVEVPMDNPGAINPNEELELWVAEGWQAP
jgi:hypothetical protein